MRAERDFSKITPTELAGIGSGHIAYMRQISGREMAEAFPDAVEIDPETRVWALFTADGTPLALTEDAGSALSSAFENNLVPVAVH